MQALHIMYHWQCIVLSSTLVLQQLVVATSAACYTFWRLVMPLQQLA
jgi:hypothetical protein